MKKPDNRDKPVAKSLHTLTVLYQVAGHLAPTSGASLTRIMEEALDRAMAVLDLAGRPDPYGLRARALALLLADQKDA